MCLRRIPFIVFLGILALSARASEKPPDNSGCLRCHSMATLGYRDPATGAIVNLSVNPERFAHSNHRDLKCAACHRAGYEAFPHPPEVKNEHLYCLDCHKDDPKFKTYRFPEIEKEFRGSVHVRKLGAKYTCFSCHNPHEFEVTREKTDVPEIVRTDNGVCLNCHGSLVRFSEWTRRDFPDIQVAHAWLPNAALHWKRVRCVECHTPRTETLSHEILPAEKAERDCVACHTTDSILLTKLYKHRAQEERQRAGFLNGVVFNDAYIIGMTRNLVLDRLSVGLFALTLLGIGGHGAGRWMTRKKRKA